MLLIQFSVFCNSFYVVMRLPDAHQENMEALGLFGGSLPSAEEICRESLMMMTERYLEK